MSSKRALRTAMLARRRDGGRTGPFAPDVRPFAARLRPGLTVASYIPVGEEADPTPLLDTARAIGCRAALPFTVSRAEPIRFLAWDGTLESGPFGLRQPPADAPEAVPDAVLVPLLAFDRRGNRLGWGAGHYDRAFTGFPDAWRVGVAWSVQEADAVPADPWDVALHAVVTEKEWIVP